MAHSRQIGGRKLSVLTVRVMASLTAPGAFFLVLVVLALFYNCNRWNTVTNSSGDLVYTSLSGESLLKKGRFFIVFPNDTILLFGVRRESTIVNGELTSAMEDSLYCRTVTSEQGQISLTGKMHTVYPQIQSQGPSLQQLNPVATRYYELTESETLLRAVSAGGSLIRMKDTVAMPHVLTTDLTWRVPLLIHLPEKFFQPGISIHGTALVVEFDAEIMIDATSFREGVLIKLFYELSGSLVEGKSISRVIGTVSVNRYYVKDYGLLTQRVLSQIQSVAVGGNTEVKKELQIMTRSQRNLQSLPEQYIKTQ